MKAKHFLMVAVLSLMRMAEAQSTNDPSLQRVQSSEQAAMAYLISVVEPKYPADVHISGKVVLRIVIDKEGHVSEAKLVSGHPMLVGATIDAVKQWKFHPYTLEKGEPVEVETTATVEFNADPPQGDVILMVVVDQQGNVVETRIVKGDPLLAEAAVDAVKQWKYKPYTLNGEPVKFETSIMMQFHL
jgi:TonB family protein